MIVAGCSHLQEDVNVGSVTPMRRWDSMFHKLRNILYPEAVCLILIAKWSGVKRFSPVLCVLTRIWWRASAAGRETRYDSTCSGFTTPAFLSIWGQLVV